ncbi:MAG: hemerythrin domain-containing protein [Kiloniellaceae bacterium]
MAGIIDSLRGDHSRLTRLLDALERQIGAFEDGGLLDFAIVDGILHYCRSYPDRHHHPCEDLVFDSLGRRNPQAAAAVGDLRGEHAKIAAMTAAFAESLDAVEQEVAMQRQTFLEAAKAFLAAYRNHIKMEEKLFFPAAERHLTAEDWRTIAGQLEPRTDPLFERREDARFDALFKEIVDWDSQLPRGA